MDAQDTAVLICAAMFCISTVWWCIPESETIYWNVLIFPLRKKPWKLQVHTIKIKVVYVHDGGGFMLKQSHGTK